MESLIKEKAKYKVEKSIYETGHTFMQFSPVGRALFLIFLIGVIPGYFVSKYLTQKIFDAKYASLALQAKPSTTLASPLILSSVNVYKNSESIYSAMAVVKNPNLDVSVSATPYTINFYDQAGKVVQVWRDKIYMLPNQEFTIVVPRIESASPVVRGELFIDKPVFQKRIRLVKVSLQAPQPNNYNQSDPPALVTEGNVYNDSPYSLKSVTLKFILYDGFGKVVTVSSRTEYSMRPYERRSYKHLWSYINSREIGSVKVIADTNTLDPENIRLQN